MPNYFVPMGFIAWLIRRESGTGRKFRGLGYQLRPFSVQGLLNVPILEEINSGDTPTCPSILSRCQFCGASSVCQSRVEKVLINSTLFFCDVH